MEAAAEHGHCDVVDYIIQKYNPDLNMIATGYYVYMMKSLTLEARKIFDEFLVKYNIHLDTLNFDNAICSLSKNIQNVKHIWKTYQIDEEIIFDIILDCLNIKVVKWCIKKGYTNYSDIIWNSLSYGNIEIPTWIRNYMIENNIEPIYTYEDKSISEEKYYYKIIKFIAPLSYNIIVEYEKYLNVVNFMLDHGLDRDDAIKIAKLHDNDALVEMLQ